ncbi:MAG: hypothetical protein RLZZ399_2487 [Verrucomicrobiota bacterium]
MHGTAISECSSRLGLGSRGREGSALVHAGPALGARKARNGSPLGHRAGLPAEVPSDGADFGGYLSDSLGAGARIDEALGLGFGCGPLDQSSSGGGVFRGN